jgi:hypothetical protein
MEPFNKPLSEITIDDINIIVRDKVPESRSLDYKRELPPLTEAGNKELLKDISAFANTVGGYLIYGVDEEEGVPTEILGVEVENFDELKQRFENLLRTGVDPVIRGVDFHTVDVNGTRKVVIIKIPRSIARPHVVRIKDHFRFYGRNSSGIHQLEVEDLRRAFLESETLATKIRSFRSDRLSAISTNETFMHLNLGAKIVLHLIPDSSLELGKRYDFGEEWASDFPPIYSGGLSRRITFDGIMTYLGNDEKGVVLYYTHVFNNGVLEAVDAFSLQIKGEKKIIPPVGYEEKLIDALNKYLCSFKKYQIELPAWVCLSLIGVKGYVMGVDSFQWPGEFHPIDRDELIISPIRIENYDLPADRILKPAFDSIWNACGHKQSKNYDENNNWRPG